MESVDEPLFTARALVLHDLAACGYGSPEIIDLLEDALAERRWWLEQWPEGGGYVAGLLAQDVQDKLLDSAAMRWPQCSACDDLDPHELRITPDLGPDPRWVCEKSGIRVADLGRL